MVVAFVGASLVGKTVVSSRVAENLGFKLVNLDEIANGKYKNRMTKQDVFAEVDANVSKDCVVDFPSNFISDFNEDEIGLLKTILKKDGHTMVYQLFPLSNLKLSKEFLIFEFQKILPSLCKQFLSENEQKSFGKLQEWRANRLVSKSLDFDLRSDAHREIADKTILTLSQPDGKEMSLREAKKCDYVQVLGGVANNIVDELTK